MATQSTTLEHQSVSSVVAESKQFRNLHRPTQGRNCLEEFVIKETELNPT